MQQPEISVVIPLYNKRGTVARCVRSVLGQSFPGFELIIVDDGSTDGSLEQLAAIQDSRMLVLRQNNQGVSAARNRGIAHASAPLIAFLDADDVWEPGFLEAIRQLHSAFPEAGLYATGVGRCWLDGRPDLVVGVRSAPGAPGVLVPDYLDAVREGDFITASNVCIPRAVLDQTGGFRPGEALGEDVELWARIGLERPLACHPEILAWYFTPPGGSTHLSKPVEPAPPLAVRTLSALLQSGMIGAQRAASVASYLDWQSWRQAKALLWQGDRSVLLGYLRAAGWTGAAARLRARLLALLAGVAPMRLAAAAVFKTGALAGVCRAFSGRLVGRRPVLVSSRIPCPHRRPACDD